MIDVDYLARPYVVLVAVDVAALIYVRDQAARNGDEIGQAEREVGDPGHARLAVLVFAVAVGEVGEEDTSQRETVFRVAKVLAEIVDEAEGASGEHEDVVGTAVRGCRG